MNDTDFEHLAPPDPNEFANSPERSNSNTPTNRSSTNLTIPIHQIGKKLSGTALNLRRTASNISSTVINTGASLANSARRISTSSHSPSLSPSPTPTQDNHTSRGETDEENGTDDEYDIIGDDGFRSAQTEGTSYRRHDKPSKQGEDSIFNLDIDNVQTDKSKKVPQNISNYPSSFSGRDKNSDWRSEREYKKELLKFQKGLDNPPPFQDKTSTTAKLTQSRPNSKKRYRAVRFTE